MSERVESIVNSKSPVQRGDDTHDKAMSIRAVSAEGGISGQITAVYAQDKYSALRYDRFTCEQPDGTYPPLSADKNDSRAAVHDSLAEQSAHSYAVCYDPEAAIEIQLETGETKYPHFTLFSYGEWNPSESILQAIYEQTGYDFKSLEKTPLNVTYKPTSDTGGTVHLHHDGSEVISKRRLYEELKHQRTVKAENTNLGDLYDYMRAAQKNPTDWVETYVKDILGDGDTYTLVVPAFTNTTVFEFNVTPNEDSKFWTVVNELGQGDPSQAYDEPVYIRPRRQAYFDDIHSMNLNADPHTIAIGVEKEWELSVTNPNKKKNPKKQTSNWWNSIKKRFNIF